MDKRSKSAKPEKKVSLNSAALYLFVFVCLCLGNLGNSEHLNYLLLCQFVRINTASP